MTESDKQKVKLKPLPCPFCGECENVVGHGSDVWTFSCLNCCAKGPMEPDLNSANASWNTRVSPDREKIREALALLENEFDHGGECDHCNEPMTKHRDTCPIGNTIGILKQLTL